MSDLIVKETTFEYDWVRTTLDVVGGKWKPLILWYLRKHPMRFNELLKEIGNIRHKVLTEHLRQLEEDGIIHRDDYCSAHPKVVYSFTDYGKTLCQVLLVLEQWGETHMKKKVQSTS